MLRNVVAYMLAYTAIATTITMAPAVHSNVVFMSPEDD
jgi:hypothetical protein